jgi:hypothetical protein
VNEPDDTINRHMMRIELPQFLATWTGAAGEKLITLHPHNNHLERLIVQSSDSAWGSLRGIVRHVTCYRFLFLLFLCALRHFSWFPIYLRQAAQGLVAASPSSRVASYAKPHAFDAAVF